MENTGYQDSNQTQSLPVQQWNKYFKEYISKFLKNINTGLIFLEIFMNKEEAFRFYQSHSAEIELAINRAHKNFFNNNQLQQVAQELQKLDIEGIYRNELQTEFQKLKFEVENQKREASAGKNQ